MKSLKIAMAVGLLFSCVSVVSASDSFTKIRAKQLAKKDGNVNYTVIKSKEDYEKYKNKMGVDLNKNKRGGKKTVINYVEIKNVRGLKNKRVKKFNTAGGFTRNKSKVDGVNFGVRGKARGNTKITNVVKVKNSNIAVGKNANMGVRLKNNKLSNVKVNNSTDIRNSKLK